GASAWSYITLNSPALKPINSVLEGDFFFVGSGVQFGGLTSRYTGPGDSNTLMCKIQNNTGAPDFDRCFIYERSVTGNTWADLVKVGILQARVRMFTVDKQCWMTVDWDQDGVDDKTIGPRAVTRALGAGFIGMNAFRTTEMDNFKYYNAILQPAANSTPKIGTTFQMEMRTDATTITPFICAFSLGNKGFPIGPTAGSPNSWIPLTADPVFNASIGIASSVGLAGITDLNGLAKPALRNIPNDKNLVGVVIYIAGVTTGFRHISNDLAVKFVQ
ncbi:MAG: hypothetical protein ACYTKC_06535, partial [Planctomycetota bacterium]